MANLNTDWVTIYCLTVPVASLNGKSPRDLKLEQLKTVVGRMACQGVCRKAELVQWYVAS